MKDVFLKCVVSIVFVIGSIAVSQTLPSLQQFSTQTVQVDGAISSYTTAVNRLEMLTKVLSLNSGQQEQAKAIFEEEDATQDGDRLVNVVDAWL